MDVAFNEYYNEFCFKMGRQQSLVSPRDITHRSPTYSQCVLSVTSRYDFESLTIRSALKQLKLVEAKVICRNCCLLAEFIGLRCRRKTTIRPTSVVCTKWHLDTSNRLATIYQRHSEDRSGQTTVRQHRAKRFTNGRPKINADCRRYFIYWFLLHFSSDSVFYVSSRISRADTHFPQKLPFDLYLTFILIHFNVYRRSLNLFGHPSFN